MQKSSQTKFIDEFNNMLGASISVLAVRTREPYRAIETIQDYTQEKERPFKVWTIIDGWETYNLASIEDEPACDDNTILLDAIKSVGDKDKTKDFPRRGVYTVLWAHTYMNADQAIPELVQCIASYTRKLADSSLNKTLVFIVPTDYKLPKELEDCVSIIDYDAPTQGELRDCFDDVNNMLSDKDASKKLQYSEEEIGIILSAGAGMTFKEFEDTLYRTVVKNKELLPSIPVDVFATEVSKIKSEMLKKSDVLELMPTGTMEDIGGLDNLKEWVTLRRKAFTMEAREVGVDKPKGIALFGSPGTGKSACAKAIAHTLMLPLIKFDVSKVFNHLVGASENRVRDALKMLEAISPCVVMLDEIDKMFDVNSGGGDSGVGKRILGNILTFMQETECEVFWVMTGNRVSGLPPELLRKGRLDEVFSVGVPTEDERKEIMRIHLGKRKEDIGKIENMDKAITASAGFVGAEIEAAIAEAKLISFSRDEEITAELIEQQFANSKPLAIAHKEQFDEMNKWAEENARPASFVKAEPVVRKRTRKATGKRSRSIDTSKLDG